MINLDILRRKLIELNLESSTTSGSPQKIIVVDDVMYYRSMRKAASMMAMNFGIPVFHIWLKVSLDVSLSRNNQRDVRVDDQVRN